MKFLRTLNDLPAELLGGAVTIGNFDGVHQGHARLLRRLREQADLVGGCTIVFTFDPHPIQILRPHCEPTRLTTIARKAELLAQLGVDAMIAYPSDRELLTLEPEQFFDRIVREQLSAKAIVEGPNFRFGRERSGDVELLQKLSAAAGMNAEIVDPAQQQGEYISSSRIRTLIGDGDVAEAAALLTAPYRIEGIVASGAGRGRTIGCPTANLEQIETLLPANGVYAGQAIEDDNTWPAAINIGPNPTFEDDRPKIEIHLIGFEGQLYDKPLKVDFLARLRDIQRFDSVEQLKTQLAEDVQRSLKINES